MGSTSQRLDAPGDAELISAVRGGETDAYGELYGRHVEAARRLARQLVASPDSDDLVSEAFARVLVALQRGGGPDLAFRAYLLTAVRRLHVDRIRATSRLHTTDDITAFDPGVPFRDTAVEGFENAAAARAFASLPERWQAVLWHTEVEGQKPAEVAPLLGMTPNSVSALAYRAREGLRQAFLTMHITDAEDDACGWTQQNLGGYVRNGLSRRDAARVENHLAECRRCTAIYLELTQVNSNLSGVLAPLLLGGAAAGYVGTTAGAVGKGALLLLVDRARDLLAAHLPASAAAATTTAAVVAGAVFVAVDDPAPSVRAADPPPAVAGEAAVLANDPPRFERTRVWPGGSMGGPGGSDAAAASAIAPAVPFTSASADPPGDETPSSSPPPPGGGGHGTPTVEQPEPPVAGADLRVTGRATTGPALAHQVVVTVSGLAPGGGATLSVTGRGLTLVVTLDGRCAPLRSNPASCHVTTAPTTFTFTAVAAPVTPAALVFTVTPEAGTVDRDRTNNRTTVPLGS